MSTPAPNQAFAIQEKLATLEEALTNSTPGIATLLRDIHSSLKKDPDVVTLLSEEECEILVRGLKKQTSTEIAVSAMKSKGAKPLKKTTLDDL